MLGQYVYIYIYMYIYIYICIYVYRCTFNSLCVYEFICWYTFIIFLHTYILKEDTNCIGAKNYWTVCTTLKPTQTSDPSHNPKHNSIPNRTPSPSTTTATIQTTTFLCFCLCASDRCSSSWPIALCAICMVENVFIFILINICMYFHF